MSNAQELRNIAKEVREACEKYASQTTKYAFSRRGDLLSMCAVASMTLHRVYKDKGIKSRFIEGECAYAYAHCWVEVEDYLIDITATQFNHLWKLPDCRKELIDLGFKRRFPKVYVTRIEPNAFKLDNFYLYGEIRTMKDMKRWGKRERPTSKIIKEIRAIHENVARAI